MSEARRVATALWHMAVLGWRRSAAEHVLLLGRALLYAVPVVIFWRIWLATPLAEAGIGHDAVDLLWYVAITEWIAFTAALPFREVEMAIRSGDIATSLTRPVPYGAAVLAEWLGAAGFRWVVLGLVGAVLATALTGAFPLAPARALALALCAALGVVLLLLFQFQIALSAVWTGHSRPAFWIWQKLLFVLGGLLLPVTLYPAALAAIARATPFAAILFEPASLVLDQSVSPAAFILRQLLWIAVILAATMALEHCAIRRLLRRGC